jgi:ABC-type molybdate transport system substrate-binding protein
VKGKHMIGCIFLFIVSLVLGACTLQKAKPVTLTLSVAASLTDAMNEIKELYKGKLRGGTDVKFWVFRRFTAAD